jgi:hypothetical protein
MPPRTQPAIPEERVVVSVVEDWLLALSAGAAGASAGAEARGGGAVLPAASAGGGGFPVLPLSAEDVPAAAAAAELSGEPAGAGTVVSVTFVVCAFFVAVPFVLEETRELWRVDFFTSVCDVPFTVV